MKWDQFMGLEKVLMISADDTEGQSLISQLNDVFGHPIPGSSGMIIISVVHETLPTRARFARNSSF